MAKLNGTLAVSILLLGFFLCISTSTSSIGAPRKVLDMYMPRDGGSGGRNRFNAPVVGGRVLGRRPPISPPPPIKHGSQQQVNPSPPNIEYLKKDHVSFVN